MNYIGNKLYKIYSLSFLKSILPCKINQLILSCILFPRASTLYDKPPSIFRETPLKLRHELFIRMASAYPQFRAWWVIYLYILMAPLAHAWTPILSEQRQTLQSCSWGFKICNSVTPADILNPRKCFVFPLKYSCFFWCCSTPWLQCSEHTLHIWMLRWCILFVVVLKARTTQSWLRLQNETLRPERWRLLLDDLLCWSAAPAGLVSSTLQFPIHCYLNI